MEAFLENYFQNSKEVAIVYQEMVNNVKNSNLDFDMIKNSSIMNIKPDLVR